MDRPWISFESGCAWIRRLPIIPICHSGQLKGELKLFVSHIRNLHAMLVRRFEELNVSITQLRREGEITAAVQNRVDDPEPE